jgi:signal transduction histidine kinase
VSAGFAAVVDGLPHAEACAVLVFQAADGPREHVLGAETLIGRDHSNDVVLSDPSVSRRHAAIWRDPEGYLLVDAGSSHGTRVDGKRVERARLAHGMEIWLGASCLRFELRPTLEAVPEEGPSVVRRFAPPADLSLETPPAADLPRQYAKVRAALELSRQIGVEHDLDRLADRILDVSLELVGADFGALVLVDPQGRPVRDFSRWRSGEGPLPRFPASIVHEVVATRQAVVSADASADRRFQRARSVLAQGVRAVVSVPLLYRDEVVGVMHLDSRKAAYAIEQGDVDLVAGIASQAAMALKNATLVEQVRAAKAEEWLRLERAVSGLPVGLVLLDAAGRVALTNALGERFLRLTNGGRAPGQLAVAPGITEILAGFDARPREVQLAGPPRRVFVVWSARAHDREEVVLVAREVTEEREREARAARQERFALIGQLAGSLTHDFANMLAVIDIYAEAVAERVPEGTVRRDVQEIRDEIRRAASLIRQVLAFGRRDDEKVETIDLAALLRELEPLLRRTVTNRLGLAVEAHGPAHIRADRGKIEQVLLNLLVNARDATPGGGTVSLSTDEVELAHGASGPEGDLEAGPYVVLTVGDTGIGMPPEVMERIFEPFFTTKEPGKGTGLGLATVYRIVKQCGGAIGVESEPGRGTQFHLYFPRAG